MMFVTCFQKDPPRASGPVIEIIPNDEDVKSVKSINEKPNGYTNGESKYNNLRAVPVDHSQRSLLRSVKSVKRILTCGCCAHPSVSPSQEDMVEVRSPGIIRHDDSPSAAVHSIRSKFTELRADSLEEENMRILHANGDQKSNKSISEKSFSSKHFEKIYSISNKRDDVYKTTCSSSSNNAHFFTRNTLNTQEAHGNADSVEAKSIGSRHSQFSQNSRKNVENSSINALYSTRLISKENISPDLPGLHKERRLKSMSLKLSNESLHDNSQTEINKNNSTTKSSPGELNFLDSFQNIVHNPSIPNRVPNQISDGQILKETTKSLSAGKINLPSDSFYQELIENKPRTALTKEFEIHNSHLEDKISVKENTWIGNTNIIANDNSDAESIGSFQSERSVSSNRLSFGRSLSLDSDESLRQVVKLETKSVGREIKTTSRSPMNTVIDKTKENSISTLVNVHRIDDHVTDFSDENNNEQKGGGETKKTLEEIFSFNECFEKNNCDINNFPGAKYAGSMIQRNEPIIMTQFSETLTRTRDEDSRRTITDHHANEAQHENKFEVNSSRIEGKTTQKLNSSECEIFTSESSNPARNLNKSDERVVYKTEPCDVTQHIEENLNKYLETSDMTQHIVYNFDSHPEASDMTQHDEMHLKSNSDKINDLKEKVRKLFPNNETDELEIVTENYKAPQINISASSPAPAYSDDEDDHSREDLEYGSEITGNIESDQYGEEVGHTLRRGSCECEESPRDNDHSDRESPRDNGHSDSTAHDSHRFDNFSQHKSDEKPHKAEMSSHSQPPSPSFQRRKNSGDTSQYGNHLSPSNVSSIQDKMTVSPNQTPKKSPLRTPTKLPKSIQQSSYSSQKSPNNNNNNNSSHQNNNTIVASSTASKSISAPKSQPLYPDSLPPFERPKEALTKILGQLDSSDWEASMQGLQGVVRLTRHHSKLLTTPGTLHALCAPLSKLVRSLRSQVARAACQAANELFSLLGRALEPELEELSKVLLSRTADTNKFLRADSYQALVTMVTSIPPLKTIPVILAKGAKHQNAIVRSSSCQLLLHIVHLYSPERVLGLPHDLRNSCLVAAAKFLLEGSLETRTAAKELFVQFSKDPKSFNIIREAVPHQLLTSCNKTLVPIFRK